MASVSYYAKRYNIPLKLARALIGKESGGSATAVSPKGATGLTQVMPSTAAGMYHISEAEAARRLKNPAFALDAGFRYLRAQKDEFGSWRLALAAYNAGPGAVRKYGGVPPYDETQDYVRTILARTGALGGDPGPAAKGEKFTADTTPTEPGLLGPSDLSASWKMPSVSGLEEVADTAQKSSEALVGQEGAPQATPEAPPKLPETIIMAARPSMVYTPPTPQAEAEARQTGGSARLPRGKMPVAANKTVRGVLHRAVAQLGQPYVWGGESRAEGGFDCSGLIQWAYAQEGIKIPRTTYEQIHAGVAVSSKNIKPGDLVFTNGGKHVVMYMGNGRVIAAPHTGAVVRFQPLSDFDIVAIRRIVRRK